MNSMMGKAVIAGLGVLLIAAPAADAAKYTFGTSPWSSRYGNWGGAAYSDGKERGDASGSAAPVDRMDAAFREHDRAFAAADRQYRDRFRSARAKDQPGIKMEWIRAYARANGALVSELASLPKLKVNRDGTDTWNGRNVKWSAVDRVAFKVAARELIVLAIPPFN